MASILLLHASGPDRDAVLAYLVKNGVTVDLLESAEMPAGGSEMLQRMPPGTVLVVQESLLPEGEAFAALDGIPLLVLGVERPLPRRPAFERLPEPFFLGALVASIERLAGAPVPLPRRARPVGPGGAPATAGLLRGLAHALNNPLAAASGWLQLLAVDLGEQDPRQRALRQARRELQRLEKLLLCVAYIGERPSPVTMDLDIAGMISDRVRDLRDEGLPVALEIESGPRPRLVGDPAAYGLFIDLLLGSWLDERARARSLTISVRREGAATEVVFADEGGTLPPDADLGDLGLLLRQTRPARALALALARILVVGRGGDVRIEVPDPSGPPRLRLRIPAADLAGGGS